MSKKNGWTLERVRQLPERIQAQIALQLSAEDRARLSDANAKQGDKHSSEKDSIKSKSGNGAIQEAEGHDAQPDIQVPVRIVIKHYRKRLADSEAYFIKPIIDACVRSGVIQDDGPKYVPQPPEQYHYKTKGEEKTVIEFWEYEDGNGLQDNK